MVAKSFARKQICKRKMLTKFVMVAKSFPRKHFCKKNLRKIMRETFFGRNCFMVAKSFPPKQYCKEKFEKNILVENFNYLQNHFLQNRSEDQYF